MPAVRIRPARREDADAILELEALFPSDRMTRRSVLRLLGSASARLWVAERDDTGVVGNLVLLARRGSKSARIYSVIVAPVARGLRLGDRLVETAENWARQQGRTRIGLEVRQDNVPALALYQRRGYAVERQLPAYYDDGADGLRLSLALDR